MSYSRSFSKTIAVHYSGSVSYPASQSGGSRSYSGTAYETVTVNVHVDTDSFDHSIDSCNHGVGILTGSVVATESAQVKSIAENAKKVGDSIINGFFRTVQSEISQQIAELKSRIDATMLHLHELSRRCVAKQTQMSNDYRRLAERYCKIFDDLDHELENRIYSLDEPVFKLRRRIDGMSADATADSGALVAVGGAENSSLLARISASIAKRDALRSINHANDYMRQHHSMEALVGRCLLNDSGNATYYAPTVYVETRSGESGTEGRLYTPDFITGDKLPSISQSIETESWNANIDSKTADHVRNSYNAMIVENITDNTSHAERVRQYMASMFDLTETKSN